MGTNKLIVATGNRGKLKEIRELLRGINGEILSLADFPDLPELTETGDTFAENARQKAEQVFRATGLPTLADDSGLCVDFLGGAPGVYSARYAKGTDQDRVHKLLAALKGVPAEKRRASFVCAAVVYHSNGNYVTFFGQCDGEIAFAPRGQNGFGYDPVFYLPSLKKTMAELSDAEKNRISHRARAMEQVRLHLLARESW